MSLKLTLITGILLILSTSIDAQRSCGAMEHLAQQLQQNPALQQIRDDIERQTRDFIRNAPSQRVDAIVTIPVVVNVVYKFNNQNISTAQIQTQLDVLNADFRRMNTDATSEWPQADDPLVEFCLASVDPDGNATSGIRRHKTKKQSFSTNDAVKFSSQDGIDAWPTDQYLNIWVCHLNGFLGYAQFPGGPALTDGVVIDYAYMGTIGTVSQPFHLGRTATHEVGHWLNLYHIWGDGPGCSSWNASLSCSCSYDDLVSDTPNHGRANYGCPGGLATCGSQNMIENYMDYTNDDCMNLFTTGQSSRMQAMFGTGGFRVSLLTSNGCGGSVPSCSDGVMNGDETGVDCGGSCPACSPTCSDGIQNQGETGIDCGGPCPACAPTCSDGIQNQGETGVDCGGPCAACPGGSCDTPAGLFASNIKSKTAKLNWSAVSGAVTYDAEYREVGTGTWSTKSTTSTQVTATGLSNGVTYEWHVRSNCNTSLSPYSGLCTFTAGDANSSSCSGARISYSTEAELRVYPNPASQMTHIEWLSTEEVVEIVVYNMIGNAFRSFSGLDKSGKLTLSVDDWNAGIYLVAMRSGNETKVSRLVVQ